MRTLSEIRQRLQMRELELKSPKGIWNPIDKMELKACIHELKWVLE